MGIVRKKPTSPGQRFQEYSDFAELTGGAPLKRLTQALKRSGGRNSLGRITIRHRGGGHKRRYRQIDFRRDKLGVPGKVAAIQYDPNRTARIALIHYRDGDKRYILAPDGIKKGSPIVAGESADVFPGNAMPLASIPPGTLIHNIEVRPGKGAQIARSAGVSAQLMAKEGAFAHIKLPSGEIRLIHKNCYATIGKVGNSDHSNISCGKAGRERWKGRRPHVRGVAMNPVDHPHGGGEGKSSGGRHPVSPWGTPTKGYRTRKNRRTDKYIVRRRKRR